MLSKKKLLVTKRASEMASLGRESTVKDDIAETSEEGDSPQELKVLARRYGSPKKSVDVVDRPVIMP